MRYLTPLLVVAAALQVRAASDYTVYELLAPGTHSFDIIYDVSIDREGAPYFFNPIRPGSVATNEHVVDLTTGKELEFGEVDAKAARESGLVRGRIAEYESLRVELDDRFARAPLAHWVERLQANDVPYAPINRIDDVVKDPQVEHLGLIVPVDEPHGAKRAVRPAVQFSGVRARSVRAAPLLNEHGAAIRAELAAGAAWPSLTGAVSADVG